MLPSRPKITLLLPRTIHPGASFEAEVLLDAKSELSLNKLEATLIATERVSSGEGRAKLELRMKANLGEQLELPKGRSAYRCRFALAQDLPASYKGERCTIDYVMQVQAAVPWWFDRLAQYVVPVSHAHLTVEDPGPSLHSSHPEGAASDEPQVEFSLNTTLLRPSDTLSGSLALFNVNSNRYRRVMLSLLSKELLRTKDGTAFREAEASRFRLQFDVQDAQEGAASTWRMKAPANLTPSFDSKLCALRWYFEVFVKTWWGNDIAVTVPLQVVAKHAKLRHPSKQRAIPTVGSDRISRIWQTVAEQHGLTLEGQQLSTQLGEVAVTIAREHRGSEGAFLTGSLRYSDLHLELDGGERTGLRRVVSDGIDTGDEHWGRRHYLTGRDPAQITSFFHSLSDLTKHQLIDIDDEQLMVATRDAGQSQAHLDRFAAAVLALARRIEPARKSIIPPLPMREALKAWRRLAHRLGGPLETARMAVQGRYQGCKVLIGTHWSTDNVPLRTVLMAQTLSPVEQDHQLVWADGTLQHGVMNALPVVAQKRFERVVQGALALSVTQDTLKLIDPAPQVCDKQLLARLELLLSLAASFTHQQGPYR